MKTIGSILVFVLPLFAIAQETIDVQRPTLTESNTTIQKKFIQFESGFNYSLDSEKVDFSSFARFGVTNNIEVRVFKSTSDKSFQCSGKVMIRESKDLFPGIALTMSYDPIFFFQDYRLCFTGSKGSFFYTINAAHNGAWYGIGLVGISLSDFNLFGEYQINEFTGHQVNGGVTYIIKNEVQLDVNGGASIENGTAFPYLGLGAAFRVK